MKRALLTILATAAALSASAVTIELLRNGDGSTLEGWDNNGFEVISSNGSFWFATGQEGECVLSQTVTLADFGITADDIPDGPISSDSPSVTVSGMADNSYDYGDYGAASVSEIDANGSVTVVHDGFYKRSDFRVNFSFNFRLRSDTRKLTYTLRGKRYVSGLKWPRFNACSMTITMDIWRDITFVSGGVTLGTIVNCLVGDSTATAPIAPRRGNDRFLGYFTEQSGGEKVYDENYQFVGESSVSNMMMNTTLYARWQPVASTMEGGITRLVYRGVLTNFGPWSSGLKKTMHVKVYDSASAATPLWSGDAADVPINPDGSFEAVFGNDELALAFASNDVTHVELTVGESLSPLAPRRAFASVASVNRALVAEGAASDIKVGTLGANAIVAEKITAASLEASETVRVEGSVSVAVKPFDIESGRETTIWRGAGVSVWGDSRHIKDFDNVVAGQRLWTADSDGVVMIHCSGSPRSTLRIPATIQFVRPGDEVRAPTYENGKVTVTFWGYKR